MPVKASKQLQVGRELTVCKFRSFGIGNFPICQQIVDNLSRYWVDSLALLSLEG
jgi:hypothetical protein